MWYSPLGRRCSPSGRAVLAFGKGGDVGDTVVQPLFGAQRLSHNTSGWSTSVPSTGGCVPPPSQWYPPTLLDRPHCQFCSLASRLALVFLIAGRHRSDVLPVAAYVERISARPLAGTIHNSFLAVTHTAISWATQSFAPQPRGPRIK